MEHNAGFAAANNAGACLARGRLLLLLNSDVLPDEPGWLGRMRDFYDSTPDIGALGAEAPLRGRLDPARGHVLLPARRAREVGRRATTSRACTAAFPAANVARAVPVVSGACMMIDRVLYEELGGLTRLYVQGDYEDSDLCLRLSQAGRENWYLPDAELYHLEGQS